jgi:hypothetical protein
VLRVLAADDDAYGVSGLVPDAIIRVATVRKPPGIIPDYNDVPENELNIAAALSNLALAVDAPLHAGDVILIEQQLR